MSENENHTEKGHLPLKRQGKDLLQSVWLLLLSIVVVALVAYAMLTKRQLKEVDSNLSRQMLSMSPKVASLQNTLTTQQDQLQKLSSALPAFHQKLVLLTQNEAWILAEAHYLVFIAKERLALTQNSQLAKAQLEAALTLLKPLPDEKYASVKLALAKDIVVLENRPQAEKERLWEEVENLKAHFAHLSFKTLEAPLKIKEAPLAEHPTLQKVLAPFSGVIKVSRESENPIPQALDTLEKAQLLRVLQLTAEETQWSILQAEEKIYQESLQNLKKVMITYLTEDEALQKSLAQIDKLATQTPLAPVPDISGSLNALTDAQTQLQAKEANDDTTH